MLQPNPVCPISKYHKFMFRFIESFKIVTTQSVVYLPMLVFRTIGKNIDQITFWVKTNDFLNLIFQLWDIRDGMCKQTFPGHESDINAVTVNNLIKFLLLTYLVTRDVGFGGTNVPYFLVKLCQNFCIKLGLVNF